RFAPQPAGYQHGAPGTPLLIQDQMGRGEHGFCFWMSQRLTSEEAPHDPRSLLVLARPCVNLIPRSERIPVQRSNASQARGCRWRRRFPAHSPLLVLPAICAYATVDVRGVGAALQVVAADCG